MFELLDNSSQLAVLSFKRALEMIPDDNCIVAVHLENVNVTHVSGVDNGPAKEIGMAVVSAITKSRGMEVTGAVDSYLVGEDIGKIFTIYEYYSCRPIVCLLVQGKMIVPFESQTITFKDLQEHVEPPQELLGDDQSTRQPCFATLLLTMQFKFDSVPDDVWLQEKDAAGTDDHLRRLYLASKLREISLLDEDSEEDLEMIDLDEEDDADEEREEREERPGARLDSNKAKELTANMFTDKDEDFLSSDD
ncbi:hypothetical protein Tco_1210970 [Tanacetum coccineum]